MKIKMSQVSRAVSMLIDQMIKDGHLQDETVCKSKFLLEKKEIEIPDKQWFCSEINSFAHLSDFVSKVVQNDIDKKKESKNG